MDSQFLGAHLSVARDAQMASSLAASSLRYQGQGAFLLYNPRTPSGWVWHTLFYMFAIILVTLFLLTLIAFSNPIQGLVVAAILAIPFGIALLIIQRFAERNAARNAAQLEEPNA
jgi:hypothetical protein